ncbi:MAG: hypothetical protein HDR50_00730 [Desulfovibrio sp.]|uniref:hypothetical protein n=1 Tax=Desulfovibrio sp. TaxID=885 RepID=UPI001A702796|nr:hypothetical protein [Desulfovibrio sp.]MBD5416217.1 hypothetical protein [Desulfovibrio sp.]
METSTNTLQQVALNELNEIFVMGMEKFKSACDKHAPFCVSSAGYIKYIPEQCFVTYFSWALIDAGFSVFNEQTVGCPAQSQKTQRFDLVARRFGEKEKMIQLKVEAKGNLDGRYEEILWDIARMEKYTVAFPNLEEKGLHLNARDSDFSSHFNAIITQNWGLAALSNWWTSDAPGAPKGRGSKWGLLKEKLLEAKKRGKFTVLKSKNGYSIDVLYAFFEDGPKDQSHA